MVRDYQRLIHRLVVRLPAANRAQYLLKQIDPQNVRELDIAALHRHLPHDHQERSQYLRVLWQWSQAHGDILGLEEEDTMSDVSKQLLVRHHIIDRHMAWERPRIEAMESYVEPGGWTNWRQHPWEPSGILPVPPEPEAAWADFVEWCRDGPYHSAEPLLRQETYQRIFTENKPYHAWELRPSEPTPQKSPADLP